MQFGKPRKKKTIINMTSLIDVLFLLLIFYMVSSTFVEQPGIKLDLPSAKNSAPVPKEKCSVYITEDEKVYFNEKEISLETLEQELKKKDGTTDKESVVLKADQKVPHGKVVKIMDIIRNCGIKKVIIGAKNK